MWCFISSFLIFGSAFTLFILNQESKLAGPIWDWLTKDASGFFTVILAVVAIYQIRVLRSTERIQLASAESQAITAEMDRKNHDREERILWKQRHAAIRSGYDFARTTNPDGSIGDIAKPWQIAFRIGNRGAAEGTFKGVKVQFAEKLPDVYPMTGYMQKRTSSLLSPDMKFPHFTFKSPINCEDQYMFGCVRWSDDTGGWRYRFCMRVRSKPPEGYDAFCEWGEDAWNFEEIDPEPYEFA